MRSYSAAVRAYSVAARADSEAASALSDAAAAVSAFFAASAAATIASYSSWISCCRASSLPEPWQQPQECSILIALVLRVIEVVAAMLSALSIFILVWFLIIDGLRLIPLYRVPVPH